MTFHLTDSVPEDLLVTIRQRLAPPDPFVNLRKALKLRSTNTGKWYLQGPHFKACKAQSSYFGWLHGSAGSGKTILSASIIDSLQQFCRKDPARSLAFFFFDFNDAAKQDANSMVKSLLSQCLERCTKVPDAVRLLSTTASEQQLLDALKATIDALPVSFVVLDALDECNNRERLFEVLEEMQSWGSKSLHVLVTSRREADIEDALEDLVLPESTTCLESSLVDADIRTYVHERLTEDKSFRRWQGDPEIREEIERTLGKQARGMYGFKVTSHVGNTVLTAPSRFRWAACQLDTLAHCLTRGKVRRALRDLPKTLYETYDRIIRTIDESQNGEEALKVLRWLVYSQRPLSANELLEVTGIVLEDDNPRFDKDEVLQDLRDILRICLSLVSIVPAAQDSNGSGDESETEDSLPAGSDASLEVEVKCIRLAHFSVKEYLTSARPCIKSFSLPEKESNDILATCCLVYLLRFEGEEWDDPECEAKFPLARYAAVHWTKHARISDCQSQQQQDLCTKLFTERLPAYRSWNRFYDLSCNWSETCDIRREIHEFPNPLFSASSEDLAQAVSAILEDANVNIDATWDKCGSALCEASRQGHRRIVHMLLAKGADPNLRSGYGYTALVQAVYFGDKRIVQMLLDAGADIRDQHICAAALRGAVEHDDKKLVEMLLDAGADIHATGENTALNAAAATGKKQMVEFLLAKDANCEAKGVCYGRALISASGNGRNGMVEMLLAHGADINTRTEATTALIKASYFLKVWTVEMLLAHGADVNAQRYDCNTALGVVLERFGIDEEREEKIAEKLIANGFDIEARDELNLTPLRKASGTGSTKIVQMLLAKGADVNAPIGRFGSALYVAWHQDYQEIIQMLEAKGARLQEGEEEKLSFAFERHRRRIAVADPQE